MQKSKLIELLKALNTEEIKRLRKFLASPFFTESENCLKLFEEIIKYKPIFNHAFLSKENLQTKLYKRKNTTQNLKSDASRLVKLIQKFIVYDQLENLQNESNKIEKQHFQKETLLLFLKERNVNAQFKNDLNAYQKQIAKLNYLTTEHFHTNFKTTFLFSDFTEETIYSHQLTSTFTKYIISQLLKNECRIANYLITHNFPHKSPLADIIFPQLDHQLKNYLEEPIIHLYYTYWQFLQNPDSPNIIDIFLKLLLQYQPHIGDKETAILYGYASNICIKYIRKGQTPFRHKLLYILKKMLAQNLILKKNKIPVKRFMNIVSVAAQCQEVEWAKQFIEDYKKYLNHNRENLVESAKALIEFHIENYEETINIIRTIKLKEDITSINVKILFIKAHYEYKTELETIKILLKNLENNLYQKAKISEQQKQQYLRFIQLVKSLVSLKKAPSIKKKKILNNKMQKYKNINLDWINQKLNEIKI